MNVDVFEMFNLPSAYRYENVAKIGQILLKDKEIAQRVAEAFPEYAKEDLTTANTPLAVATMVSFIEEALRPKLVAEDVIKKISDFKNKKGINSIIVPKDRLITAVELTEGATIPYAPDGYSTVTITKKVIGAASKMTWELLQQASIDLIKHELSLIGFALANKIDQDIIAKLDDVTTDANDNRVITGGSTEPNPFSYDVLVDALAKAEENYTNPDVILIHPGDYAELTKDTDIKLAMSYTSQPGKAMNPVQYIMGLRVIKSPNVPKGKMFLIDTKRCGYYVDFSDVVTYDGRIPDTLTFEVISAKAYGVEIVQPKSVTKVEKAVS